MLWIIALLIGTWVPAFTYRVVEVPGAWETFPMDISNQSHIAGYYSVKTYIPTLHGFVYDGTGFLTIDYPGAFNTRIHAINDNGDVCGDFTLAAGTQPYHAFVRTAEGAYTEVNVPGAIEVRCEGINNNGDIFGNYTVSPSDRHTFILRSLLQGSGGQMVLVNISGAQSSIEPRDINDAGQAVGYFMISEVLGFVRMSDGFLTVRHPSTNFVTQALGISDDGLVAGRWNDSTKNLGFLWYRGQFVYDQITVPTAQGLTLAFGANRAGEVTGYYMGQNAQGMGGTFGFVAVPTALFNPRIDRFSGLVRLVRPRVPLAINPEWARPDFGV